MKFITGLLFALVAATSAYAESTSNALPNHNTIIGKIGDQNILLGDIENQTINRLRGELYQAILAAFQNSSAVTLRDKDPQYGQFTIAPISDSDIEKFYRDNQLQRRGSLDQLKPKIQAYLEAAMVARLNNRIYGLALQKNDLTSYLSEPEAYTVKIPVETAYLRGNEQATTMLMEFSDFQCPYCQKVQPTIKKLVKQYGENVAFGYRHFPLDFHKDADDASIAIECARDQGEFEPMQALLFKQQRNQSRDELKELASRIELKDIGLFNQCLDSNKYADRVARDMQVGQSVGITGTPGFIIGRYDPKSGLLKGELLSGAQPDSAFVKILEKYLAN